MNDVGTLNPLTASDAPPEVVESFAARIAELLLAGMIEEIRNYDA